jgi:hypothetical protein
LSELIQRTMPTKRASATVEPIVEDPILDEEQVVDSEDNDLEAFEQPLEFPADPPEDETGDEEEPDDIEQPERVTGEELLAFAKELSAKGKSLGEIAYAAGYYSVNAEGKERVLTAQLNQAILAAQGFMFARPDGKASLHRGRERARVVGTGMLQVSQLACRQIGAEPGRVFSVEYPTGDLVGVGSQILLTMTGEVDEIRSRRRKGQPVEEPGAPLLGAEG